eukprot:CAMPEP_0202453586 /NCGR_PEP_ID=MMETSP1360-20130828/11528_1 /ASSEMBLY_ACC=CAM_ASM_000848 /TAXON_ID=515479 /ORGANISM="Licmophora paradoxa, Strain CCMP2313" /LENGTH=49 /DNA_ID= /DNA_START= /DNA_END= /DNA_ORIENTATION=
MAGATHESMKELKRVLKYVLDTRNYGLRIEPMKPLKAWHMLMFCDSDYA